jgi:hypothetical protein
MLGFLASQPTFSDTRTEFVFCDNDLSDRICMSASLWNIFFLAELYGNQVSLANRWNDVSKRVETTQI